MTDTTRSPATDDVPAVDPRAPRFGQAVTATLLLVGIALQAPAAVYAVAAVLVTAAATGWRVDLYGALWRSLRPVVGEPSTRDAAAPHRFAKLLGAVGTALATALLVAGLPVAGYAVAGAVALAAGLAATTGICLGCRLYRQVGVARRLGVV